MELRLEVWFDKNPVLLVEDNPLEVRMFMETLRELEIPNEVITASNGQEALDLLDANLKRLPGLILLDINMPRMNGIEMLRIVKGHRIFTYIPVVILTSSASEKDREAAFGLGAAGYLTKPLDHSEFVKMIGVVLNYWSYSQWYHIPESALGKDT
jgi:CheY-like chemotaxis protein